MADYPLAVMAAVNRHFSYAPLAATATSTVGVSTTR